MPQEATSSLEKAITVNNKPEHEVEGELELYHGEESKSFTYRMNDFDIFIENPEDPRFLLAAECGRHGDGLVISFSLRNRDVAGKHLSPFSSKEFIHMAIRLFENRLNKKVVKVESIWDNEPKWTDILEEYLSLPHSTQQEMLNAARQTWTGQILRSLGFEAERVVEQYPPMYIRDTDSAEKAPLPQHKPLSVRVTYKRK